MKSIREIYRTGYGPSSSHTMGPAFAAEEMKRRFPDAELYRAVLYGSLAKTGRGHGTDTAMVKAFLPCRSEIIFDPEKEDIPHPNTIDMTAYRGGAVIGQLRAVSIGGGAVSYPGYPQNDPPDVYPESSFTAISEICKSENIRLSDYVFLREGEGIKDFLSDVWRTMRAAVKEGLSKTGVLPGGLGVERKAQYLYNQRHIDESAATRENRIVCAYAFAVAEQNADSGIIVTAPTCGSCGVVPAALLYMCDTKGFAEEQVVRALAVGGLIGSLIKQNASISGAECGCQAEIGSACSMCAAALSELHGMGVDQVEYAAEVAMEHHLGLTCDPVRGLVQIPCIERNAVAAMRAINALSLANFLTNTRKISFDTVVETMYRTGLDINRRYRETSEGGLAEFYGKNKD